MAYIGNQTTTSFSSMAKQSITGNGGTGYTLTHAVANAQEIEVFVNNVRQEPGVAYTVSGTTLTMTGNVASSDDFYVVYQGLAVQTSVPGDNTVTTAMMQDTAVTAGKLASTLDLSSKTLTIPQTSVKPIYVAASRNGVQTLTDDTFTLVQFNNQLASSGLSWDTSNYKCTFSAANAGTYAIRVGIAFFSGSNTFQEAIIQPLKNGSEIVQTLCLINGTGGGTTLGSVRHFCGISQTTESFASGDEFSVKALFEVGSGNADIHQRQFGTELLLMRIGD